jgi:hypothetical protein
MWASSSFTNAVGASIPGAVAANVAFVSASDDLDIAIVAKAADLERPRRGPWHVFPRLHAVADIQAHRRRFVAVLTNVVVASVADQAV